MRTEELKIGIVGGTFDPVHHGHLITAQSVLHQRNLDKILFIPCFISPHKTDVCSSSPADRLEMLKLSIAGNEKFSYSDYEIANEGISYTINTIRYLKETYNNIELIIGYDNFVKFDTWKEPDKIVELAKLIVLKRSYNETSPVPESNRFKSNAIFVDTPLIDISSTGIRDRVKNNLPIDFLLPESVKKYIIDNKLYK